MKRSRCGVIRKGDLGHRNDYRQRLKAAHEPMSPPDKIRLETNRGSGRRYHRAHDRSSDEVVRNQSVTAALSVVSAGHEP